MSDDRAGAPAIEDDGGLLGREVELADLTRALASAERGEGAVRLLVGEPGIGKTRLADATAARAAAAGFEVAWGRAWEAGGAPPLWPWTEALRTLGAAGALEGASGSEADRFRAFAAARDALRARSARAPVLVVLDDLHAADEATLDLALFAARGLRGSRVLLLGTWRDVESRRQPAVEDRLARIAREGRRLDLARLAPDDVARLATRIAPALSPEQVQRVVGASEGNPLFADELARLLGQRGTVAAPEATTEGIQAVVLSRLALLPPGARRTLEAASVLGRTFHASALEMLGADATGGAVPESLALAARASGLVAAVPGREAWHAFSHALVRDAIHLSLAPGRRAALHHAHSLWLEASPGVPAAEVAHHALLGLPAGPTQRALALARDAAARASALGAYADAADFLERALDALGASREPAMRCDLGIALAEALARAGLSDRSRETAAQAADLARALSDPERLARAVLALGFTTTLGVVSAPLVRALRDAIEDLGDRDAGLSARLTARLASALQPAPDPLEPIALALRAVELARASGDHPTLLATLYAACSALGDLAAPEVRAPLDAECAALAAELGDLAVEQRARARHAIDLVELGRLGEADRAIGEVDAIGERLALPVYRWRPALLRSMRALMAGRFEESARRIAEAEALAREVDDHDARVGIALHRVGAAIVRGAPADELRAVAALLGPVVDYGPLFFELGEVASAARLGGIGALRRSRLVAAGFPEAERLLPLSDLQFAGLLSVAFVAAASPERCGALLERLRPAVDREVTWGLMGLIDLGPLSGVLALLAAAAGREEDALHLFERALARCEERGLLPAAASLHAERATLLGWLGRGEEVKSDRARSEEIARAVGMVPSRILETRAELGLAVPRREPGRGGTDAEGAERDGEGRGGAERQEKAGAPDIALVREGDVWAVTHGGSTFRVRHVRGLEMLATLLAYPGRAFPAVELDLTGEGAEAAALAGDAGEVLDGRARDAYRLRASDLAAEIEEAERFSDPARASRAREELDALADELARGVGLGGRARRAGSRVERSRVNVQRRLKDAIQRIGEHDPALGRRLERSVRTGIVCTFEP